MELKNLLKKATDAKDKLEKLDDKLDDKGIKEVIKKFITSKKSGELEDNTDLFKNGYVNSLFALEIVTFLEKTFKIKLGKNDISKENFTTVENIANLVKKLLNK